MQRLAVALLLVGSLFVSGCTTDGLEGPDSPEGSGESVSLEGIPEGEAPSGTNAGSATTHGQPARTETPVTVTRNGDRWIASKTITFENDFGGASSADVHVATEAGGVAARGWSSGGYKTVAVLRAEADSEAEAREWLPKIVVTHTDKLSGSRLSLATTATQPNTSGGVSLAAGITASLPRQPSYDLSLQAHAGGATTQGLSGPSVDVDVDAGGASIDGAFGSMTVDADAGGIELLGTANDVIARAEAGGIGARLRAGGSGSWTFDVTAGGLDVDIERTSGDAFDVQGTVTAGGVTVSLSDGETLSDGGGYAGGSKHVRSRGFSSAAIQVTVDASVTAGGLAIQD